MTKPGVYTKVVNGKKRKVRILANGQWRFLKGSANPSKSRGAKTKGTRKATTMAKKRRTTKKKAPRKRPGLGSWFGSMVQLGLTFANPVIRIGDAMKHYTTLGDRANLWARYMIQDYLGCSFDKDWNYQGFEAKNMIRGYSGPIAGYAFKKATGYMLKGNKISLIPRLR